jgi:hypothetical protein
MRSHIHTRVDRSSTRTDKSKTTTYQEGHVDGKFVFIWKVQQAQEILIEERSLTFAQGILRSPQCSIQLATLTTVGEGREKNIHTHTHTHNNNNNNNNNNNANNKKRDKNTLASQPKRHETTDDHIIQIDIQTNIHIHTHTHTQTTYTATYTYRYTYNSCPHKHTAHRQNQHTHTHTLRYTTTYLTRVASTSLRDSPTSSAMRSLTGRLGR